MRLTQTFKSLSQTFVSVILAVIALILILIVISVAAVLIFDIDLSEGPVGSCPNYPDCSSQ